MLEITSSFGSTSSSPSFANLAPIRDHVMEDLNKVVGIEDQFAQISVADGSGGQKSGEGILITLSSPPSSPVSLRIFSGGGGGGVRVSTLVPPDHSPFSLLSALSITV